MSQFTSGFWDIYITALTLDSIVACAVLLKMQSARKVSGGKVGSVAQNVAQTTGHTWDGDLGEYNNPLPGWWMWLFYITIAFALVYLYLYPGLGSYAGSLNWTQVGQLEEENAAAEKEFGPQFQKFAGTDLKVLAADPAAHAVGQKLFLNHCAQCHASDAGGSKGFPNLTDRDWLYGGEPEIIKASITNGRNGVMPPLGAALGEQKTKDVAHYVMSLSGLANDSLRTARGKETFAQICAACHGPQGTGNPQLGAPNLTDKTWLYGSGEATIIETITKGRTNQMPAHKTLLSEPKIHLLAGYVYSLSQPAAPPGK
jgi:cytochrome c oxidase cbb3-type subunit III